MTKKEYLDMKEQDGSKKMQNEFTAQPITDPKQVSLTNVTLVRNDSYHGEYPKISKEDWEELVEIMGPHSCRRNTSIKATKENTK